MPSFSSIESSKKNTLFQNPKINSTLNLASSYQYYLNTKKSTSWPSNKYKVFSITPMIILSSSKYTQNSLNSMSLWRKTPFPQFLSPKNPSKPIAKIFKSSKTATLSFKKTTNTNANLSTELSISSTLAQLNPIKNLPKKCLTSNFWLITSWRNAANRPHPGKSKTLFKRRPNSSKHPNPLNSLKTF